MSEETENSKELKYEGLTALIIQGQENAKDRHEVFVTYVREEFANIRAHNKKQNGAIQENLKYIGELQKESNERKLTCKAAVDVLQSQATYSRFVKWIDEHGRLSVLILFFIFVFSETLIVIAIQNNWLKNIWDIIKGI